jgi:XTP/dITP diphosphohydrolase
MQIVLATSNQGKIKEIKKLMPHDDVVTYESLLGKLDIEETGSSFKENAIIKAKAIYDKLNNKEVVVLADDSGISVPLFNSEPGIYSARYAKVGASDEENLNKLIQKLKAHDIQKTAAFYTACIALVFKNEVYTTHGWMHGDIINKAKGTQGFGYDPMFIPKGYDKTLGELSHDEKKAISHRSCALALAQKLLKLFHKAVV